MTSNNQNALTSKVTKVVEDNFSLNEFKDILHLEGRYEV